jgi:hypothetical protein
MKVIIGGSKMNIPVENWKWLKLQVTKIILEYKVLNYTNLFTPLAWNAIEISHRI